MAKTPRKLKPRFKNNRSLLELEAPEPEPLSEHRAARVRVGKPPPKDEILVPEAQIQCRQPATLRARNALVFAFYGQRIAFPKDLAPYLTLAAVRVAGESQFWNTWRLPGVMFTKDCVDFSFPALRSGEEIEFDIVLEPGGPDTVTIAGVKVLGEYRGVA